MLQVVQADELSKRATRQHEKLVPLDGQRGEILDRDGRILATDVEVPSVYAIPALIDGPSAVAKRLARLLSRDAGTLKKRLDGDGAFTWIARRVDPAVKEQVERQKISGIGFLNETRRFYPNRVLLGHILGFTGIDNNGLEGLELKFDGVLRGQAGSVVVTRDALGRPVLPRLADRLAPIPGRDLVLTIDEVIQHVAERELEAALVRTSAESGSVIVMDPGTGEILAIAVRPVFNPNAFSEHRPSEWRNRTVTDFFEPGSTFKIVASAAALQEGLVDPDELIDCEMGVLRVAGRSIHDHERHGLLTFRQVLQKSSNVGMVKVGSRLGPDRLYRYIRDFGFGEKTGIDLTGESPGHIRPVKEWTGRSIAAISIGQEMAATPVQLITAVSAIANGGWLMRPYVVAEIRGGRGEVERTYPLSRRRVIDERTSGLLKEILATAVEKGGTGEGAAIPGYTVAGKTGTAQKIDPATRKYSPDRFVSSFVGFAPVDKPRIAVLVVIDSPKGESWGGKVAAPVFRAIGQAVLPHLGVKPATQERLLLAAGAASAR